MTVQNMLPDDAFPPLYRSADHASMRGQSTYIRATLLRLGLAVLAALVAVFSLRIGGGDVDIMAAIGAAVFASMVGVEFYLLAERPERTWYDGRALAESAKTLTWRYAVGGAPFALEMEGGEQKSRKYFRDQLAALLRDAPETGIEATTDSTGEGQLEELRSRPLEERKRIYVTGRIVDQQQWYAAKARGNRSRASAWRMLLIGAEVLGIVAAVLRALNVFSFDLAGLLAAVVGASSAWLAVKQYESLARAYAYAANELALARARLEDVYDEADWASEVADAEEAISREHTMWRASRSTGQA